MLESLAWVFVGLLGLILGGDLFIRGAAGLAGRLGVSSLVIGLTVVGFGTSIPELVTSVEAAVIGEPELALANVIGSNTANILLILAVAALIAPIRMQIAAFGRDCVALGVATMAGLVVLLLGGLERWLAAIFVLVLVTYTVVAYRSERNTQKPSAELHAAEAGLAGMAPRRFWLVCLMTAIGLALVVGGASALVDGSVALATLLGVSSAVIGLTVVAVGTSLPELVTSIIAALRKQPELAFGNVLGSNVFNVFCTLGITGLIEPLHVRGGFDAMDGAMFIGSAAVMILFARRLTRMVAVAFLLAWIGYGWWLFQHG